MRIGIVCPYSFDHPGGVQAHILDLAERLISRGHEVKVLGPATTDVPEFVVPGGASTPVSYNGSTARVAFGPKAWRTVKRFLDEGCFDVVHLHEPNAPSMSLAALCLTSVPVVATYHASASRSFALRIVRPLLSLLLNKIRAGIAVSETARRWQVEQLGGDPILIPNGVPVGKFARPDASKSNDVHVLFLGRIDEPRKGLSVLIDALKRLPGDVRPRVTVAGAGQSRQLEGVHFVGRVTEAEKVRLLQDADIYVAPNTGGESFGIVLVEAMAAGCAVLASDLESFQAVCDAGSQTPAGKLFKVGDSQALARDLSELLVHEDMRRQLAQAGRKRARMYDWEVVTDQIEQVYAAVVTSGPLPKTKRNVRVLEDRVAATHHALLDAQGSVHRELSRRFYNEAVADLRAARFKPWRRHRRRGALPHFSEN